MRIAIIPARGGSKRVPRKNVRSFFGKPMLLWSIEKAVSSDLFDKIVVSTDDEEIAELARSAGVEVPFLRPENLADDITPTVPVIAHAIALCESLGWSVDLVCCMYPVAPFVQSKDLKLCLELLIESGADYSFPVVEYPAPVQRALKMTESGLVEPFMDDCIDSRSQDLEKMYFDAGQFYWGRRMAWSSGKSILRHGVGLPIPGWRTVDVDTEDDWRRAQLIYKALESTRD